MIEAQYDIGLSINEARVLELSLLLREFAMVMSNSDFIATTEDEFASYIERAVLEYPGFKV